MITATELYRSRMKYRTQLKACVSWEEQRGGLSREWKQEDKRGEYSGERDNSWGKCSKRYKEVKESSRKAEEGIQEKGTETAAEEGG